MSSDLRKKGRAIFLAALMVLSVVAMGAAFAGSAAAEADLSGYEQPDPANFDLAVTSDGSSPDVGDFTERDTFQSIGAAVKEADNSSGGPYSILVFSNTTETNIDQTGGDSTTSKPFGADNPAVVIDGSVVDQVASYDGPEKTTISFDGSSATGSAVFDVNDGAEVRGLTIGGDWRQYGVVAGENATLESNVIKDSATQTETFGDTVAAVGDKVTIKNNKIQLSNNHDSPVDRANYVTGILFSSDSDGDYAKDGTVSNNDIIATNADDDNLPARGVEIASSSSVNTLSDNNFTSSINTEVYYVKDLSNFDGNIINNNDFDRAAQRTGDTVGLTSVSNSIELAEREASSGETIEVASGTYNEKVDISTENIRLAGNGIGKSVINGSVNIGQAQSSTSTNGTIISGFTINSQDGDFAIETTTETTENILIENNRIVGEAGAPAAAYFQDPVNISINDNEFAGPEGTNAGTTVGDLLVVGAATSDDGDEYSITNNTFENTINRSQSSSGGNAVEIRTDGVVKVEYNDFGDVNSNNGALIWAANKATAVTISQNNIVHRAGTSEGLIAEPGAEVAATYNWWGDTTGPGGEGTGTGANVSTSVEFKPYYANADKTQIAEAVTGLSANYDGDKAVDLYVDSRVPLDNSSIEVNLTDSEGQQIALVDGFTEMANDAQNYSVEYTFNTKRNETVTAELEAAEDEAGNAIYEPRQFNASFAVDTSAFDLTVDQPAETTYKTSEDTLDVKYSYSDTNPDTVWVNLTATDGATYSYEIDDSQYANDDAQKALTIDLSEFDQNASDGSPYDELDDDTYDVTVKAIDSNSGTSENTAEGVLTVDDTKPSFTAESFDVEDNSSTNTNFSIDLSDTTAGVDTGTIEVEVTDANGTQTLSGDEEGVLFDSNTLKIDTQNVSNFDLAEGEVTVNFSAEDNSGNDAESTGHSFTVNTLPPTITDAEAEAGTNQLTVTFSEPVMAEDGEFSPDDFAYTDVSNDGASAIDSVTNDGSFTKSVTITLDNTVAVSDLATDEINAMKGAIADENDENVKSTAADTVALRDTNDPEVPWIEAGEVTASNVENYTVTVSSSTTATANVTVSEAEGDNSTEKQVDMTAGKASVDFNLSGWEDGVDAIKITAVVTDRGVQMQSEDTTRVTKDAVRPALDVTTNVGNTTLDLDFSEPVNVNGVAVDSFTVTDVETAGDNDRSTWTVTLNESVTTEDIGTVTVGEGDLTDDVGNHLADRATVTDDENPEIIRVNAKNGSDTAKVLFDEPVYAGSGDGLTAANFSYADENNESGATGIESVGHTNGTRVAELTLNDSVAVSDISNDTVSTDGVEDVAGNLADDTKPLIEWLEFKATTIESNESELTVTVELDRKVDSLSADLFAEKRLFAAEGTYDRPTDSPAFEEHPSTTLSDFTLEESGEDSVTYSTTYEAPRDGTYRINDVTVEPVSEKSTLSGIEDFAEERTLDADVDTSAPEPVDAEIVEADDTETLVWAQFDEPVYLNDAQPTIEGINEGRINYVHQPWIDGDVVSGSVIIGVEGTLQTGDAPEVTFGEGVTETTNDSTGVQDVSVPIQTAELVLSEGVNFVSVPAATGSLDISELDTSNVESIMTYDRSVEGNWATWTPNDDNADDFDELEGGVGYVVKTSGDTVWNVNVHNTPDGGPATPQQTELQEGWNLVGHWQEGSQDSSTALQSIQPRDSVNSVYAQQTPGEYDYTTVERFDRFTPGEAYWVFVTEDEVYGETPLDGTYMENRYPLPIGDLNA